MTASKKKQFVLFSILVIFNVAVLIGFNHFLNYTLHRACVIPFEPFHNYFNAIDFSRLIFTFTYGGLVVFLLFHIQKLVTLNAFLLAFLMLTISRIITIYIFPFCEPANAIELSDEVLNSVFYPNGYCGTDLFFSGHTATLFLLGLITQYKTLRWLLFSLSLFVGILVIVQKVHYTVDVLAAWPLVYGIWVVAQRIYGAITKVV